MIRLYQGIEDWSLWLGESVRLYKCTRRIGIEIYIGKRKVNISRFMRYREEIYIGKKRVNIPKFMR